ncbi:hypothetical protein HHI36_008540 [Cryptolaemus montrouzieri]|uniref:Uncharacterized protein n=1 Tax=Cryptolaemus montrouzieri TaxID=559131 RepID=A0ABD2MTN4_9CUCU
MITLWSKIMSKKIDAKEVLTILNQMGYKNINSKHLKLFIKDLKKLRKYEERKGNSNLDSKQAKSVKIILTKPSGSVLSLMDDIDIYEQKDLKKLQKSSQSTSSCEYEQNSSFDSVSTPIFRKKFVFTFSNKTL